MIEYELTFLAKYIPEELIKSEKKEILDIYLPSKEAHCDLRIRKNGDKYEIIRKRPIDEADSSIQQETNIALSADEFAELSAVPGKRIHKWRFAYHYQDKIADVDVFLDDLAGLVLIEFEFPSQTEKDKFIYPDFCLAEVTQVEFTAGGMLAGKKYADIEEELERYKYKKLIINE
ncbi:MAG: hypothetical protein WC570_03980 [Patescibacteria group bacterium]